MPSRPTDLPRIFPTSPISRIVIVGAGPGQYARAEALLTGEGHETIGFGTVAAALASFRQAVPDLVLAAADLQEEDQVRLVSALRYAAATLHVPVVVVAERHDRALERRLMEGGANDFLVEPVSDAELIGAVNAQLQRSRWLDRRIMHPARHAPDDFVAIGTWAWYPDRRLLVAADGTERRLTLSEARLLKTFLDAPGVVLDRDRLLSGMGRPAASPFDRSIDIFVGQLRRKLKRSDLPEPIRTVRSTGYALDCPVHRPG